MGFGVVEVDGSRLRRIAGGVIRPAAGSLGARLGSIQTQLAAVIEQYAPDGAAVENVFSARNPRSALALGHARGVALAAFAQSQLEPGEYSPSQVKSAVVGYGQASKMQVQQMVQKLLGLTKLPPNDEADALAIAICHGHTGRARSLVLERTSKPRQSVR